MRDARPGPGWPAAPASRSACMPGLVVAQDRGDRREQLVRVDRLDQVGVGAAVQALGAVDRVDGGRRDVDDRRGAVRRIGLDLLADLEAAHVRQPDVEHDQVDAAVARTVASASAAGRRLDRPRSRPGAASWPARTASTGCRRRPGRCPARVIGAPGRSDAERTTPRRSSSVVLGLVQDRARPAAVGRMPGERPSGRRSARPPGCRRSRSSAASASSTALPSQLGQAQVEQDQVGRARLRSPASAVRPSAASCTVERRRPRSTRPAAVRNASSSSTTSTVVGRPVAASAGPRRPAAAP